MKTTFVVNDGGTKTRKIVKVDSLTKKENEIYGSLTMYNALHGEGIWKGNTYYPPSSIIKVILSGRKG